MTILRFLKFLPKLFVTSDKKPDIGDLPKRVFIPPLYYSMGWFGIEGAVKIETPHHPHKITVTIDRNHLLQTQTIVCRNQHERDIAWWNGVRHGLLTFHLQDGVIQRMAENEMESLLVVQDIVKLIEQPTTAGFFQIIGN